MELTVQDWVILVGIILILAILLDGYRRMRSDRGEKIRVSLVRVPGDDDPDELLSAHELPSGGARVVSRSDLVPGAEDEPEQMMSGITADRGEPAKQSPSRRDDTKEETGSTDQATEAESTPPEEVLMVHVHSNSATGFAGHDILQILLACDLRFGHSSFFHRHEEANGRGAIQFSVANMVTPGQFSIDAMDGFTTPGLTFFLGLPGPRNMMQAYEYMMDTARCVAENLDGSLLDETRSVLTHQSEEHGRQRIRDLERRLLARR